MDEIKLNPSEEIIKKAEENEKSSESQFMSPKDKKSEKKRGRPKKEFKDEELKKDNPEKEAPKFNIPTKVICYPITKAISAAGVSYTNEPRAALTPDEAEGMAEALGLILDKYMPDVGNKYGPELMLSLSLGQYGLRLYAIKKLKEEQLKKNTVNPNMRPQDNSVDTSGLELSNQSVDAII